MDAEAKQAMQQAGFGVYLGDDAFGLCFCLVLRARALELLSILGGLEFLALTYRGKEEEVLCGFVIVWLELFGILFLVLSNIGRLLA